MIGGKLASYRLFAQQMTDVIACRLGTDKPCRTATLQLPGAYPEVDVAELARRAGIDRAAMARLVYRHRNNFV